ncbi:hypothetical protein GCM10010116_40140 [Microbispora rosea subsp. aerata]|nr:hypothetical protein [Microbispora rosea]GGO20018.1 hypothetical protein GCM10010116_40140 [Microbispora rosea subsp. aerata]GIH57059.1 hypothetical protein Mro02_39730 [Microbispora rosea subsp. aerata]GLJ83516.1 hypothetical protein GCM10017588_22440 [Microbispora rosea subsp. aerata]
MPAYVRAVVLAQMRRHRVFTVALAAAAVLRVVTMLGYPPARMYWYDSFAYLYNAVHLRPEQGFHPIGYPLLLRALLPFHSVEVVVAVQHAMGLATGAIVYAVLRGRGLPTWAAVAASAPVLFDASFLRLEHAVVSDTLFILLVVAATALLARRPAPTARAAAAAGLLLAGAALTRTIALPLILLVLLLLAARRVPWRRLAVLALTGLLPVAAYAAWYGAVHGRFGVTGTDGVALWARSMTFADCAVIRPPRDLAPLCPNGTVLDAAGEYVWAKESSLNRLPGGHVALNDRARAFALRAIAAQPLDDLRDVAADTALAFAWTPVAHPARTVPAFGFALGTWPLPEGQPLADQVRREYDPDLTGMRSVRPYADLLIAYQYPAYLRGPVLGAILLLGLLGALRRPGRAAALLPWAVAVTLLVAPVAVLDFDHRYVLPVVPVACLAAGLAFARPPRRAEADKPGEPPAG